MENKIAWEKYPEGNKREEVFQFAENYRKFISDCKTERECVTSFVEKAEKAGFVNLEKVIAEHTALKAGDRVYANNMGKGMALFVIGKESMEKGMNILGAHIDSPRLDLKQDPLYEDTDFAMLDTHYYGGIKKYQWVTLPLALHGVIAKKDGTVVKVNVGDKPGDPVFGVSDLLIHLSGEQLEKKAAKVIEGENLDLLIGSIPMQTEDEKVKEKVKANIMNLLSKEYGIEEEDFLSAEIEVVPAGEARDYGFDRSMIGGYGHDDRVCSYPALQAILDIDEVPEYTALTVLTDKEETGSDGNTGLNSSYLKYFVEDLARLEGYEGRDVLSNSKCLSADVNAAFDPTWSTPFEKNNSSFINEGVCVTKFTGARGKGGTSDASAEYVSFVKNLLESNGVLWQSGELGKVDAGGGGTVAMYIANLNVDVIDVGVPVLSMHSPYEIVSKIDTYMAYKAFKVFFTK